MAGNLETLKLLHEYRDKLNEQLSLSNDMYVRAMKYDEIMANNKRIEVENERLVNEYKAKNITLTEDEIKELDIIIDKQKQINNQLEKEQKWRDGIKNSVLFLVDQFKIGLNYLMAYDKIIKETILNLGMSGAKAEFMRVSFEQSIDRVAELGAGLEDIQAIQQGFAEETGRARALTKEMLIDVTAIGKGTGLGIEAAAKLGAQFEYMGLNVKATADYVQGVVDTSERMGVNTTKVLKSINDNFKKLSTFTFVNGIKGFAEMAVNAEKTRVSMETALNVAEATRNLESVIELGANLQVMGGEFAKMDPFQWLYMARNEPEKMTEKISQMTAGIYTLRKNSDGTFEKFISPADRDRLANVAKSLGIAEEKMFEIAQRKLDMSIMDRQLAGMGLTKREKELIQGAATMNTATGRFEASIAGQMVDISKLTKEQAAAFASEQSTLKERALEAQTFEEAIKNTINSLKGALLPILRAVNGVLEWVRPMMHWMSGIAGSAGGWWKAGGILLAGAALWKGVIALATWGMNSASNKLASLLTRGGGGKTGGGTQNLRQVAARRAGANAGKGMMRGGAGIGAAALGVGAGIGVAAMGIGQLAESMAKLDETGLDALPKTIFALSAAIAAFVIPLAILGSTATVSSWGLAALGATALGIGAGIGLAAMGIGEMAKGLGSLIESSKGAGDSMMNIGKGIAVMSAGMMGFTAGAFGLVTFAATMKTITKNAEGLEKVGNAFKNISTALVGNKEDFVAIANAVESIAKLNVKGGGMLSELSNLLKKPLKVEFADSKVAVVSDITLNIDGQRFMQKIYRPIAAIQREIDAKLGQSAGT